jgi:hypothetical protein
MFLFTPTLSSALYMLLMRMAARMYREAFRMAEACVTDTPLSAEEKQAFEHLGALNDDQRCVCGCGGGAAAGAAANSSTCAAPTRTRCG